MQKGDGHSSRDYKTVRDREQIKECFNMFSDGDPAIQAKYIRRLKAIRATLESSEFFHHHEVSLMHEDKTMNLLGLKKNDVFIMLPLLNYTFLDMR